MSSFGQKIEAKNKSHIFKFMHEVFFWMIILIIPEMNIIVSLSCLQFNLTPCSFFSLEKIVGYIKLLYISDGCCRKFIFITSYHICSWLLFILLFFWKTTLVVSHAKILLQIFIPTICKNFKSVFLLIQDKLKVRNFYAYLIWTIERMKAVLNCIHWIMF